MDGRVLTRAIGEDKLVEFANVMFLRTAWPLADPKGLEGI